MPDTIQGISSSQGPYVIPAQSYVTTTSLLTTGDSVDASGWRFAGIPDGAGAFSNGDGTLTLVMNHELGATSGIVRDHGSKGAFVDIMRIDAQTGEVLSGDDLAQHVYLWNGSSYAEQTTAWNRLCSGDLAAPSAFYDANSGLGTQERIFLTGEEAGNEGRAFAFVVTDTDTSDGTAAGGAYELPWLGNLSFEDLVANAHSGPKTVVVGTDDAGGGQLYVYVGDKQATGTAIEKAGLTGGDLFGVRVPYLDAVSASNEVNTTNLPKEGVAFTLQEMGAGGDVSAMTGAQLQTESVAEHVAGFLRPEDGAWDPTDPNRFYFVTTNSFDGRSKLWSLEFDNVQDPQSGGTLKLLLDGTEGQHMLDNLTVTEGGLVILQEDPGGNAYLARIWMYDPSADTRTVDNPTGASGLTELAHHDPARFLSGGSAYLTQDEESSGVFDATALMGDGERLSLIYTTQAHYGIAGELVEGGQLQLMNIDLPTSPLATLAGTNGDDLLAGGQGADTVDGDFGDDLVRGGAGADRLIGNYGADTLEGGQGGDTLEGGVGDDQLSGGQGLDLLLGGTGDDGLDGGQGDDVLAGEVGADRLSGGEGADTLSGGFDNDTLDGGQGADSLAGGNGDDVLQGAAGNDVLSGGFGADRFEFARGAGQDRIVDFQVGEDHIVFLDDATVTGLTEVDLDLDGIADATMLAYSGGSVVVLGVLSSSLGDFLA